MPSRFCAEIRTAATIVTGKSCLKLRTHRRVTALTLHAGNPRGCAIIDRLCCFALVHSVSFLSFFARPLARHRQLPAVSISNLWPHHSRRYVPSRPAAAQPLFGAVLLSCEVRIFSGIGRAILQSIGAPVPAHGVLPRSVRGKVHLLRCSSSRFP